MKELELYVHIPFCEKKCNYCDFLSAPADEKSQSAYMEGLNREIAYYGKKLKGWELRTIYIGGGTPSVLPECYMEHLMQEIYTNFPVDSRAEITIECNPGTLNRQKLECYKKAGINRLSMGLQSADNEELKILGRIHTYEQFLENYQTARDCGFANINIDLMNSLPKQTLEGAYQSVMKALKLKPEHISSYSLMIEKGTPFYDRYKFDLVRQEAGIETEELPSEDTAYQIGKMTQDLLAEHGYLQYEISNYAAKGFQCRHNIGYWQRKNYLGVGLGAASLMEEVRYSNQRNLLKYIKLSQFSCPELVEETQKISREACMEEFMFLGLRMTEGILKGQFYTKFGVMIEKVYGTILKKLIRDGLMEETPSRLFLTDLGMDLSNYVLAQFLLE